LAEKGVKKVKSVAQSISAITHTIQSIISTDSRLLSPFIIVLKELNETLGSRIQETMFIANSIFYYMASKSGKLTSNHFETWIKEVFFPNGPNSVLLLDSWSGYN